MLVYHCGAYSSDWAILDLQCHTGADYVEEVQSATFAELLYPCYPTSVPPLLHRYLVL